MASLKFNNVYIKDSYTIAGMYENDGPLGKYFDKKYEENKQAKINKMKSEINPATGRNKYTPKDIEKFINN